MSITDDDPADQNSPDRRAQRVRHDLRFRLLDVQQVNPLTPHMLRVTLGGDELEGFYSPGFDDHIKVIFPAPGKTVPPRPTMGDKGPIFPDNQRPIMRDFTPRRYDAARGVLEIDFALHESGPATDWAKQASPGQKLVIGGPRGSFILPLDFDWYLLIGDETALPAIARRLAELPKGSRVVVLAEVESKADELSFDTRTTATVHWIHRDAAPAGASPLLEALTALPFPEGDYHGWIACESSAARQLRQKLIADHGANPKWLRAAGYWKRGAMGVHENLDE